MKQIHEAVEALESDIGFWRPSWKTQKKNYQANPPGPVCILQIFGNNPSRGFRVRAETKSGGGRAQQLEPDGTEVELVPGFRVIVLTL